MAEVSEGGRPSELVAAPPRYDKFGFLTADADRRRRNEEPPARRSKRRRSRSRSSRSDSDRSRSRNRSRSRSRTRNRNRGRSGGDVSEWERDHPYPPPPINSVQAPTGVPAPSYPTNVAPAAYPNNYGNQFHPGYGGFAPVGPRASGQEATAPPNAPNNSQWGPPAPPLAVNPTQDEKTKREAIASELRNQRATLGLQKEEYVRKANVIKRELESLKEQRTELRGDTRRSPSPETQKFLKENAKLQDKLQSKLKTMNSVIEMLNGIIENNPGYSDILGISDKEKKRKSSHRTSSQSPSSEESSSDNEKRPSRRKSRKSSSTGEKKFNYAYYDPELHWCRVCNEFPTSAKDYLTHLHTPQHHRAAAVHMEAPWHSNSNANEGFPSFPSAPIKRTPIKGLQFFVPSTAWYCKLCDLWIGDLHCASAHLKSVVHSKNYTNFTELNPHWEMDWMSDRQKNFEKKSKETQASPEPNSLQYSPHTISFQADGFHTKYKKHENNQEEENTIPLKLGTIKKEKKKKDKKEKKKKKKRSTSASSSSSESSSDSKSEDAKKKKNETQNNENWKPEEDPAFDDRLINQWMSVQDATTEQDRKMLEEVKNRVKSKAGERVEQRVDGRVVSREREARELLTIKTEQARQQALNSSKSDAKEKEKERDYRSSHRDKDSDRRRSDKSHHRDKDRDYESSKHRHSSSNIKTYTLDSDFKPYPGKRENHDANESRFDKQVSSKSRKSGGSSHSNSNDSRKMPFIGKMPLYKNQGSKSSKSESEPNKQSDQECMEAAKKKRDEINAQLQKSMDSFKEQFISTMAKRNEEMEAHMLPEPKLIAPMSLHSHVPIVDVTEMMIPKAPVMAALPQTIHRIQSQQSISAQTTVASSADGKSKNDLLHKDFQDALDIIFPSDDKPKQEIAPPPSVEAGNDDASGEMEADPNLYSQMSAQGVAAGYQVPQMISGVMTAPYHMSHMNMMTGMMMGYDYTGTMYDPSLYDMSGVQNVADPGAPKVTTDMEDLAMLGIDAEDVGAGGF